MKYKFTVEANNDKTAFAIISDPPFDGEAMIGLNFFVSEYTTTHDFQAEAQARRVCRMLNSLADTI